MNSNDLIKRIDGWQYDVPADMKLHALLMDCKAALEAKGEPVCYITQAALDALKRGASSSVRVWLNPDEPNGDVALYTKENP